MPRVIPVSLNEHHLFMLFSLTFKWYCQLFYPSAKFFRHTKKISFEYWINEPLYYLPVLEAKCRHQSCFQYSPDFFINLSISREYCGQLGPGLVFLMKSRLEVEPISIRLTMAVSFSIASHQILRFIINVVLKWVICA